MGKLCVRAGCSCPWVWNNSLLIELQPLNTSVFRVPNTIANYNDHTEAQTSLSCYCKKTDVALACPFPEGIGWVVS